MATLKKSDAEATKAMEELAQRWLNYLKFRLKQDGATFREQIVEWFGRWIIAKPKRIVRYEAADFKMLDQFLDFAWPAIMDPKVPMPPEPAEPQKVAGLARAVPTPQRNNNWWGAGDQVMQEARVQARQARIDWHALEQQANMVAEQEVVAAMNQAFNQGQQWIHVDENGNWRPANR